MANYMFLLSEINKINNILFKNLIISCYYYIFIKKKFNLILWKKVVLLKNKLN